MVIKTSGTPYTSGDVVVVTYTNIDVGRFLSFEEAKMLNSGKSPWPKSGLTCVRRPKKKIHYYPSCGGKEHKSLARSIKATTCRHCLMERARQLKGWRWSHPYNHDEVSWLILQLCDRVKDFGNIVN
jgi:hypothetical protein